MTFQRGFPLETFTNDFYLLDTNLSTAKRPMRPLEYSASTKVGYKYESVMIGDEVSHFAP